MDTKLITCHICEKTFVSLYTYCRHLRNVHRISAKVDKLTPLKINVNRAAAKVVKIPTLKTKVDKPSPLKTKVRKVTAKVNKPSPLKTKRRRLTLKEAKEAKQKRRKKRFTCTECQWTFVSRANLTRHQWNIHPKGDETRYKCGYCSFDTPVMYYLKRHMEKHDNEKPKPFQCAYCEAAFDNSTTLVNHERKRHTKKKINYHKKCPKCSFVSTRKSRDEIEAHFRNMHNISITWELLIFDSLDAFQEWKNSLEVSLGIQYRTNYNLSTYYVCSRSGNYHKNIRSVTTKGSYGITGYCPSALSVKLKEDGKVMVRYVPCHVGHNETDEQVQNGDQTAVDSIIESSIADDSDSNQIHFNAEQGRQNSENTFNIDNSTVETVENHEDWFGKMQTDTGLQNIGETFSIDRGAVSSTGNNEDWVEKLRTDTDPQNIENTGSKTAQPEENATDWVAKLKTDTNTSLFHFNTLGVVDCSFPDLKEDDCLLIYMSNTQKSLLEAYGKNIIYVDNGCELDEDCVLKLFTMLVIDNKRQSIPVAFMFTNISDEDGLVMSIFVQKIKEHCGSLIPKIFLSDIEGTVLTTWCKIMGPPKMCIFPTVHVLKAWQDNLLKIRSRDKRENVFKVLKTLLYKTDKEAFHKLLDDFLQYLINDNRCLAYLKYFQDNFVENMRYKNWAHSYLKLVHLDVSLDNFQTFLKQCCDKVGNLQSFDEIVRVVLKFSCEKVLELSVGMEKCNPKKRPNKIVYRHKKSLLIPTKSLLKVGDDAWEVMSATGKEFYSVKKVKNCYKCQKMCTRCKSCLHEFVCTCEDFVIGNNMCKHIHFAARRLSQSQDSVIEDTLSDSSIFFETQNDTQDVRLVSSGDKFVLQSIAPSNLFFVSRNDTPLFRKDTQEAENEDGVAFEQLIQEITPNEVFCGEEGDVVLQEVRFREKLQKFVDYCQDGTKSREQIAYLEKIIEQAMCTADSIGSVS